MDFSSVLFIFLPLVMHSEANIRMNTPTIQEYFPNISSDLTQVSWAHAVNDKQFLHSSIANDSVMMLEADISLGRVNDEGDVVPIMAHPPKNVSDLSLQEFMETVIEAQAKYRKGVKLDFKSDEVFNKSWDILDTFDRKLTFPVWVNADIIRGPIHNTDTPRDPDNFLQVSSAKLPDTTLSVGWTTTYFREQTEHKSVMNGSYTDTQLNEMRDALIRNNITQPVTLAVRAGIIAESKEGIMRLVQEIDDFQGSNQTTLTVWQSNDSDEVDVSKLRDLILTLGKARVFLDVPQYLRDQLDLKSATTAVVMAAQGVVVAMVTSLATVVSKVFQFP